MKTREWLFPVPLIAILRGIKPNDVAAIGGVLVREGFHLLEVPLNSPSALESVALLQEAFGDSCVVGAGTVLDVSQVAEVAAVGGRLIVMPHGDADVIAAAKALGMICVPGVATPTEAFAALRVGADALKVFPAEQIGPSTLKAWRSVLPVAAKLLPVGGITPAHLSTYLAAGANGCGIGSALYSPGQSVDVTAARAREFVGAWRNASEETGEAHSKLDVK